jgi:superfamily II RNA helicase
VSAPTGSGKTVLADYVIERSLHDGRRVIYTAPIKALSNQKFRDFHTRHGDQVGIMTGDVTLNPGAPLLIMTTEIYRNTLLEAPSRLAAYAWIIFDEVHYLDDRERGTVWEEAILFTPPHINLLALSATIPNAQELTDWIRTVHGRPIEVIEELHRPVPLTFLFQCQNAILDRPDALKHTGYRGLEDWSRLRPEGKGPSARGGADAAVLDGNVIAIGPEGIPPAVWGPLGPLPATWEVENLDPFLPARVIGYVSMPFPFAYHPAVNLVQTYVGCA